MIEFNSKDLYYKKPFGAQFQSTDLFLRIKVKREQPITEAVLIMSLEDRMISKVYGVFQETLESENKDVYTFLWTAYEKGLFFYHFEATYFDGNTESSDTYQLTVYSVDYKTPEWLKSGVMYQIFPDRFARSNQYAAPLQNKDYILREDWGGIPNNKTDEFGVVKNNDFFGGNIRGIIEKLDYLKELSITVIYLNPIFEAYSNHRYDTADYMSIDPMLGTLEDFKELCREAKERGIRIILDGVFNHTGSDSIYFNKKGRYPGIGAYQSKDSAYYKWYSFEEYPDDYAAWWGISTLPSVNEADPTYMDYIIRGENSVVRHWIDCGASGFRLDVADELTDEFLEELRSTIKAIDGETAIIGEVWEDASNKVSYGKRRKYLLGNQLDTVMNYPLKDALIHYLIHDKDGVKLENIVNSLWENYPKPAFSSMMNILGTHDTVRILSIFLKKANDYEEARQSLFLGLLIIAFMPGIPCIYYGDEIGMRGGRDPYNRMCFDESSGDHDIFKYYKRLFAFRKRISDLPDLEFSPRFSEGNFYSYKRIGEKTRVIVAANSGEGDILLDLKVLKNEKLSDLFVSGDVSFERDDIFRIKRNSGIAVYIKCTE